MARRCHEDVDPSTAIHGVLFLGELDGADDVTVDLDDECIVLLHERAVHLFLAEVTPSQGDFWLPKDRSQAIDIARRAGSQHNLLARQDHNQKLPDSSPRILVAATRAVADDAVVDVQELVAEQISYYRSRAAEYDSTATPPDDSLAVFGEEQRLALDRFWPEGDVLEIACGTGGWTHHLLRHPSRVTAIDASPEMLTLARAKVGDDPRVRFVCADVFTWRPEDRYDVVFFANWLSHVPPVWFDAFWETVRRVLRPDGRVFLIDELADAWRHEKLEMRSAGGEDVPIAPRLLKDGRQFGVVKVYWPATDLESRLRELGWEIDVHPVGPFFWAQGQAS